MRKDKLFETLKSKFSIVYKRKESLLFLFIISNTSIITHALRLFFIV